MEEKAVFVGIIRQGEDERKVKEYLDELEFLAETAGVAGDKKFIQKLDKPEKATYIRSGNCHILRRKRDKLRYIRRRTHCHAAA